MIRRELGEGLVPFDKNQLCPENEEQVAVLDEALTERVLSGEALSAEDVTALVRTRKLFPVYFGAALSDEGVEDLLEGLCRYTKPKTYPDDFGAVVYKVTREGTGPLAPRLVWMKLTGERSPCGMPWRRGWISQKSRRSPGRSQRIHRSTSQRRSPESASTPGRSTRASQVHRRARSSA